MIISQLTMHHFRQFYGTQTIEFAHDDQKLVTVILYSLYRSQMARMDQQGKVKEEPHQLKLHNFTSNEMITRADQIQDLIFSILDERVKHYFFFDGERIERLTRATQEQKKEISVGIRNLLKIDQAVKSRDVLQHLLTKTNKELQKHSTGEYKQALQEKEEFEKSYESLVGQKNKLEEDLAQNEKRQQEVDQELVQFEKQKEAIQRRKQLEEQVQSEQEKKTEIQGKLVAFNSTLSLLLAKDVLYDVKKQLDLYLGDHRQEDMMSAQGLRDLIEDLTCICGRSFEEDSDAYQRLQSLYNAVEKQEANQDYHNLKADIMQLLGFLEDKEQELKDRYDAVKQQEKIIEDLFYQLEQLNRQLSNTGEETLQQLNEERETLLEEKAKQKQTLNDLKGKIEEAETEKQKLDHRIKDLKAKSGVHQQLLKKEETLKASLDAMKRIIKNFEQDVVEDLEMAATQNLSYLLDDSGRANLKEVKVQSDYSLDVLNAFNQPFLANISQGQRQVLSLSFITALAQVAGGTNNLEMPLFMDTPFGRLSSKHQMNLMSFIPQITSQWVLLVTDREYGQEERQMFDEMNVVGRFYHLESTEPGVTVIKEKSTAELGGTS